MNRNKRSNKSDRTIHTPFSQTFFHGTKAGLQIGDLIETGIKSNYGQNKEAKYIYFTATLDAAVWGAELASGEGNERICTFRRLTPYYVCGRWKKQVTPTLPCCSGQSRGN